MKIDGSMGTIETKSNDETPRAKLSWRAMRPDHIVVLGTPSYERQIKKIGGRTMRGHQTTHRDRSLLPAGSPCLRRLVRRLYPTVWQP